MSRRYPTRRDRDAERWAQAQIRRTALLGDPAAGICGGCLSDTPEREGRGDFRPFCSLGYCGACHRDAICQRLHAQEGTHP